MHIHFATIVLVPLLSVFAPAVAATSCNQTQCGKGLKVVTYATPTDGYFVCPTRQLSEYTHFVLGLISMHTQVTGKPPALSSETGEPQYQDETKNMLNSYRKAAGVTSFSAAAKQCAKGLHGVPVSVEDNPDGFALQVSDASGKKFWLPKVHADKP